MSPKAPKDRSTKPAQKTRASRMPLRLDYTNMLAAAVGEHGLDERELAAFAPLAREAAEAVAVERAAGKLGFTRLPYPDAALLKRMEDSAAEKRRRYTDLVVLGIGGSALGTLALRTALLSPFHNVQPPGQRPGLALHVLDNVDPGPIAELLDRLDPRRTLFNVISKSGTTAETTSQMLIAWDYLTRKVGAQRAREQLVCTTDPEGGALRKLVARENLESFPIPPSVGGRFSVLTPVGLFPALCAGIDARGLLAGAAAMEARTREGGLFENPALLLAALLYLADVRRGQRLHVMMPYSAALSDLADWFRQLWAESLGKKKGLDGSVVHAGPTPVRALGATDQHSQVQLYVEGPFDKVLLFLEVRRRARDLVVPRVLREEPAFAYLGGKSLGGLLAAELAGTRIALADAGRPSLTLVFERVTPETVGQFFFLWEMATAYAGKFYGVDAFDQPGVEAGKLAAYALMGRKGYEKERSRIEALRAKLPPKAL